MKIGKDPLPAFCIGAGYGIAFIRLGPPVEHIYRLVVIAIEIVKIKAREIQYFISITSLEKEIQLKSFVFQRIVNPTEKPGISIADYRSVEIIDNAVAVQILIFEITRRSRPFLSRRIYFRLALEYSRHFSAVEITQRLSYFQPDRIEYTQVSASAAGNKLRSAVEVQYFIPVERLR